MPNHVENILRISGPADDLVKFETICRGKSPEYKPSSLMIELGLHKEEDKEEVLTFSGIVPVPAEIVAQTYDRAGYDWQNENWGTKWDAYGPPQMVQMGTSLLYTFQTAWNAPELWLRAAAQSFKTLRFELFARSEQPFSLSIVAFHDGDGELQWEVS